MSPSVDSLLSTELTATLAPHDLVAYATHAALQELHTNWTAALAGGMDLHSLLHDIPAVQAALGAHHEALLAKLPPPQTSTQGTSLDI